MIDGKNHDATVSTAALQDEEEIMEAYMFQNQFFPEGEFHVISGELEAVPNPAGVGEGRFLSGFNTRLIQYTNAPNTIAFFFPFQDADVDQGVLYRLGGDWEDIGEDEEAGETPQTNLVNVTFSPVGIVDEEGDEF